MSGDLRMPPLPWYREPWPWILAAGPALVLVAGAITMWIAFASADGLVAEDYYKQGLGINKVLKREEAARSGGISASLLVVDGKLLRIELRGDSPPALFAHLAHATRAGYDQRLRLERRRDGSYAAALPPLPAGRWRVAIEDPQGRWRITREAL